MRPGGGSSLHSLITSDLSPQHFVQHDEGRRRRPTVPYDVHPNHCPHLVVSNAYQVCMYVRHPIFLVSQSPCHYILEGITNLKFSGPYLNVIGFISKTTCVNVDWAGVKFSLSST
jgi:hypothetical protein